MRPGGSSNAQNHQKSSFAGLIARLSSIEKDGKGLQDEALSLSSEILLNSTGLHKDDKIATSLKAHDRSSTYSNDDFDSAIERKDINEADYNFSYSLTDFYEAKEDEEEGYRNSDLLEGSIDDSKSKVSTTNDEILNRVRQLRKKKEAEDKLPAHLDHFKKELERFTQSQVEPGNNETGGGPFKLPIIRQITPRTRKKLSIMPPPLASDAAKAEAYYSQAVSSATASAQLEKIYQNLTDIVDNERAIKHLQQETEKVDYASLLKV